MLLVTRWVVLYTHIILATILFEPHLGYPYQKCLLCIYFGKKNTHWPPKFSIGRAIIANYYGNILKYGSYYIFIYILYLLLGFCD